MTAIGNAFAELGENQLVDLGFSKNKITNLKNSTLQKKKPKVFLAKDRNFLSTLKSLGNAMFTVPRIYSGINYVLDGNGNVKLPKIPFRQTSINMPNGILNVFYFGNEGFLKNIKAGRTLKVNSRVTKKTIIKNGKKTIFYNLDLMMIRPILKVSKKIEILDKKKNSRKDVNLPKSQGGSINLVPLNK